jgi:ATP-dependent exoDNAse (exonuclease V) beta subunit
MAHPEGWDRLAAREDRFVSAEGLRLRYVAATRAGSALIVTERPGGQCSGNSAWKHFAPYLPAGRLLVDPGRQEAPAFEKLAITAPEVAAASREIAGRLTLAGTPTHDVRAAKEYALSELAPGRVEGAISEAPTTEGDREPPPPPAQGEHGVEWGQAIHQLLELAMGSPDADIAAWAATVLEENGLDASHAPAAAETVAAVVGSDIWARARSSNRRMTEVPFHVALDAAALPTVIRGAIDLVFEEQGGWVLVDFKTDAVSSPEDVGALADRYAPQLRLYARSWELCTGEKVSEAGLYFVRADRFETLAL